MLQLEQLQSGPQWHPFPDDEQPQSILVSVRKVNFLELI